MIIEWRGEIRIAFTALKRIDGAPKATVRANIM